MLARTKTPLEASKQLDLLTCGGSGESLVKIPGNFLRNDELFSGSMLGVKTKGYKSWVFADQYL